MGFSVEDRHLGTPSRTLLIFSRSQQEAEISVHFLTFHGLGQTALQPVLAGWVG